MAERLTGGCACGAIRYESDAEPLMMLNCHCRDCQRASGSAFAAILAMPKAAVRLTGEPRYYGVTGGSGKTIERGFCPQCGSPVMATLERFPDMLGLQAGSLDDPSRHRPAMDVFTASAQPWDHMDPALPKHAQAPVR